MKTSHKLLKPLYIAVVLPGLIFGSTPQGAKRKKTEQVTIVTLTSLNSKNQVISTGAGFIVSDGVIATSYGVVRNAAKIRAELATETARTVQLLAVDQHRSVALLKLTGDSPDILRVLYRKDPLPGDRVYVVGGGATPDPINATIGQPVSVGRTHYVTVKLSGSNPPAGSPIVDQNGEVVGLLGVENGGTVSFLVPVSSIDHLLLKLGAGSIFAGGVPGNMPGGVPGGVPGDISGGQAHAGALNVLRRVEPVYPRQAQAAGVTGAVVVEAGIDEAGNVISADAVSGHELLREAAVAAAMGWKFAPTKLNGVPQKAIVTITFNFQM